MVQNELKQDNKQKPSTNTDRLERPFFLYVGMIWSIIKASCKLNIVVPLLGKDRTNSHKKLHVQGIKYSNRERAETKSTQMEEYTNHRLFLMDACIEKKTSSIQTREYWNKTKIIQSRISSLPYFSFSSSTVTFETSFDRFDPPQPYSCGVLRVCTLCAITLRVCGIDAHIYL